MHHRTIARCPCLDCRIRISRGIKVSVNRNGIVTVTHCDRNTGRRALKLNINPSPSDTPCIKVREAASSTKVLKINNLDRLARAALHNQVLEHIAHNLAQLQRGRIQVDLDRLAVINSQAASELIHHLDNPGRRRIGRCDKVEREAHVICKLNRRCRTNLMHCIRHHIRQATNRKRGVQTGDLNPAHKKVLRCNPKITIYISDISRIGITVKVQDFIRRNAVSKNQPNLGVLRIATPS